MSEADRKETRICFCGILKQQPSIHPETGVEICLKCNLPTTAALDPDGEAKRNELEEARLAKLNIKGRSASDHREIVESLISELAKSRKYGKAIKEGDFTTFSFVGTNDWEDYASLSISALNALAIARIDENLDKIRTLLEKQSPE